MPWASAISSRPSGGGDRAQRERHARSRSGCRARPRAGRRRASPARRGPSAGRRRWRRARSRSRVDFGASASCGIRMNEPNMPKPTSRSRSSSSAPAAGAASRCRRAAPAVRRWSHDPEAEHRRRRPRTGRACACRPSPTRWRVAIASSGAARPTPSTSAPRTSTRPGVRTGDSGTNSSMKTAASAARDRAEPEDPVVGGVVGDAGRRGSGRRRRRCRTWRRSGRCSSATFSRGNSSRMIPKQSGKMPPPAPCRTRPATTTSRPVPSAETTEPAANTPSAIDEQAALAEHVAEAAEDRRAHGGREQVAGERPGDAAGVGVERLRRAR